MFPTPHRHAPILGALLTSTALLLPPAASAQTAEDDTAATATATATATPAPGTIVLAPVTLNSTLSGQGITPEEVYRLPAAVSTTDAETLQVQDSGNPQTALRAMPGVFTRQQSNQPGLEVNIRGLSGYGRVNQMIDGVPQTFRNVAGHEGAGGQLLYTQSELLAGVDVVRGAVPGAAGAGALAGAANFRSIEVDDVLREGRNSGVMLRAKFGSNGYNKSGMIAFARRHTGQFGGEGEVSYILGTAYTGQSDYEGGDSSTLEESRGSANSPKGSLAKIEIAPNGSHRFDFGVRNYDNRFSSSSYNWHMTNLTWTAGYHYDPGNPWLKLDVRAWTNRTELQYYGDGFTYVGRNTEEATTGFSVTNDANTTLGGVPVQLTSGVTWNRNEFTPKYAGGANNQGTLDKASLFTEASFDVSDRLNTRASLRYDWFRLDGYQAPIPGGQAGCPVDETCGDRYVSRSDGRLLPRVGATYKVNEAVDLYATYAWTFRPPTTAEAFFALAPIGPGVGTGIANNIDLKPETSRGVDLGVNMRRDGLFYADDTARLKVGYFRNRIRNFIVNDPVTIPGREYQAAMWVNRPGTTTMSGIEIEGVYDAGFGYARLSFADTNTDSQPVGELAGLGNGEASVQPDRVATVDLGLRLIDRKLTLGTEIRYVGKSKEAEFSFDGVSTLKTLDAYTLIDLYASYDITDSAQAFFTIENVGDRKYGYAGSGLFAFEEQTGRGRTFIGGVTARF